MYKNKKQKKSKLEIFKDTLDSYLVPCYSILDRLIMSSVSPISEYISICQNAYVLPVESTMIPDNSFLDAIANIHEKGKVERIIDMVIVPEARKKLGDKILPYEDIKISHASKHISYHTPKSKRKL